MFETVDERLSDFAEMFYAMTDSVTAEKYLKNQNLMAYLNSGGFFTAPASTKYHGAYEGGLYEHCRTMTIKLAQITERMGILWQRPESVFIVGMFHDLCKCDQYTKVITGEDAQCHLPRYEFNDKTILKGHGAKSVMILSQFITLTEEELLCIRYHMGAYEKEEWTEYDMAIRKYPNVLWTHTADMFASKVIES